MTSKAGKAVRLVDQLNSKLRKKVTSKSNFQLKMRSCMQGSTGLKPKEIRKKFKDCAVSNRGTTGVA